MAKKRKKQQGHFCKVCGERKANEKFSGKGHANHICKQCSRLSAAERSEMQTLRRIDNMAFRYINDSEVKWLRNRMKDSRDEVREAAIAVHQEKFPNYGKPATKQAKRLEMHIQDTIWDEWGDEIDVYITASVSSDGLIRHIDHTLAPDDGTSEMRIKVKAAKQLLRAASDIQEESADFNDMIDPDIELSNLDEWLVADILEIEQTLEDEPPPNIEIPVSTLTLTYKGDEEKQLKFSESPISLVKLYWDIYSWFEPDDEFDYDEYGDLEDIEE